MVVTKKKKSHVLAKVTSVEKVPVYSLTVTFNGVTQDIQTDDIEATLEAIAPRFLKTKLKLIISKGDKKYDGFIFLPVAKKIFKNKIARRVFVQKLIFK